MTNLSDHAGRLLVTYGDGDEDKPPRLKDIPAGESREYAITQTGHFTVVDFKAEIVPLPKHHRPKPRKKQTRKEVSR